MIPKIIHQTWKNETLPEHFNTMSETWKKKHPSWEYKLWTDKMNRDFIEEFYPDFLKIYDNYPKEIQRVDAVRYFILLKFGGVYVDVDFQCFRDISPILINQSCVIGKEPQFHCDRFSKKMILCNAFMASSINNDFMKFTCEVMKEHKLPLKTTPITVLESTGPFLLTNAYYKYAKKNNIKVLDSSYLYPLTMFEVRDAYNGNLTEEMQEKLNSAYGLHFFWGNW